MRRRLAAAALLAALPAAAANPHNTLHFPSYRSYDGTPVAIPCIWMDPISGNTWDLRGLTLPGSAYVFRDQMTDEEHDSVHAALAAAAQAAREAELRKSGRLMDQGIKAKQVNPKDLGLAARAPPVESPDEYDFWVNVCTNVGSKPPICVGKAEAPIYQVVVPKAKADDKADDKVESDQTHLARAARAAPAPTECHALGSLRNASFGLIKPNRPELGVALTYRNGDECLKRVMEGNDAAPHGAWVAVPRQTTVRLRCDPSDATDRTNPASVIQLTRRVRVVETEMCEYVVEWPTKLACPRPSRKSTPATKLRASLLKAPGNRGVLALGALALVVLLLWQLSRQAQALAFLGPLLRKGDTRAWRVAAGLVVSPTVAHPGPLLMRSMSGGVPRSPRLPLDVTHDF